MFSYAKFMRDKGFFEKVKKVTKGHLEQPEKNEKVSLYSALLEGLDQETLTKIVLPSNYSRTMGNG